MYRWIVTPLVMIVAYVCLVFCPDLSLWQPLQKSAYDILCLAGGVLCLFCIFFFSVGYFGCGLDELTLGAVVDIASLWCEAYIRSELPYERITAHEVKAVSVCWAWGYYHSSFLALYWHLSKVIPERYDQYHGWYANAGSCGCGAEYGCAIMAVTSRLPSLIPTQSIESHLILSSYEDNLVPIQYFMKEQGSEVLEFTPVLPTKVAAGLCTLPLGVEISHWHDKFYAWQLVGGCWVTSESLFLHKKVSKKNKVQCKPDISWLVGSKQWYRDISESAIYRATVMSPNQAPFTSALWAIMGLFHV